MIELYQFPFSHYCEKVRWALDYKGIAYRTVNLLPGFHFRYLAKLAPNISSDGYPICNGSGLTTTAQFETSKRVPSCNHSRPCGIGARNRRTGRKGSTHMSNSTAVAPVHCRRQRQLRPPRPLRQETTNPTKRSRC
jgi:hypothetical protein